MAYSPEDKKSIKEEIKESLFHLPQLLSGSEEEIKDNLYTYLISNNSITKIGADFNSTSAKGKYLQTESALNQKFEDAVKGIDVANPSTKDRITLNNERSKFEDRIIALKNETYALVAEYVEKELKPILNVVNQYAGFLSAEPIEDINAFYKEALENITSNNILENVYKERAIKKVAEDYTAKTLSKLVQEGFITPPEIRPGQTPQEYFSELRDYLIMAPAEERQRMFNEMGLINIAKLKETAKEDIEKLVAEKKDKLTKVNKEYEELTGEIESVFEPEKHSKPLMFEGHEAYSDIHETFKRLVINCGYAKSMGIEFDLENNLDYKEVKAALVRKEVLEQNKDDDKIYKWIMEMVDEDPSRKHEAVKVLKRTKQNIMAAGARVAEQLDEMIPKIYLDVLAGDKKTDTTHIGKTKGYLILNDGGKIETEWKEGCYAKTGLLKNFEDYVEELNDGSETQHTESGFFNKLTGGLKSIFGIDDKKPNTKVDIREIESEIIRKHKKATGRRLEDIAYADVIQIFELIQLAKGLAVKQNDAVRIKSSVNKIKDLKPNSDIDLIIKTYLEAAKIGEMINRDTETLTRVREGQFYAMDNYINKKSGWMYSAADKIGDFGNDIFKLLGFKEYDKDKLKGDPNWTFDRTAIRPKGKIVKYGVPAAIAMSLLYLGSKAYGSATGEPQTKENNKALGAANWLEERFMELLMYGTVMHITPTKSEKTIEVKEAPKEKVHEKPKAPKAEHTATPATPATTVHAAAHAH